MLSVQVQGPARDQGPTAEEAELGAAPDSPWTAGCRNSWVPFNFSLFGLGFYLSLATQRVLTDLII